MDMPLNLYKGQVTHIIDPSCFWMKMGTETDFEDFEKYQTTLNQFYNQNEQRNTVVRGDLSNGDYVVVRDVSSVPDSRWKRAQIARTEGDTVDVFYVDVGYTELVNISQVRHINKRLFEYLPPQAVQSGVAGIRPLSRTWTKRATTTFKSKVVGNDVLVFLVEFEESFGAFGKVVIYTRLEDGSWRSLIHHMAEEDVGMLTDDSFEEFLTEEVAKEALQRTEALQAFAQREAEETKKASEDLQQVDEEIVEDEGNNQGEASNNNLTEPDTRVEQVINQDIVAKSQPLETSVCHLPSPADFLVPPQMQESTSTNQEMMETGSTDISKVTIPKCDVSQLKGYGSLSELKKVKEMEAQQQLRAQLEQDLQDCQQDESQFANDVEWVQSDLHIGETHVFKDVHDHIANEIYRGYNRQSSETELEPFFKSAGPKKPTTMDPEVGAVGFDSKASVAKDTEDDVTLRIQKQMLSKDEEETEVKKKIEKILTETEEPDMLYVLVNSVVEPDKNTSLEDLIALISAVLESLIPEQGHDPSVMLGVLESHTASEQFEIAILTVLKKLKDDAVKLHSKVIPDTHGAFAKVLAMLFIQAESWPFSVCACVHEYAVASLERWVVFNKQRLQSLESSVKVELMYLNCVEKFLETARDMVVLQFPKRYLFLLEEMRFKLLHDATCREVRSKLLDLILLLHKRDGPMPWAGKPKQSHTATQTDAETNRKSRSQDSKKSSSGHKQTQSLCDLPTEDSLKEIDDPMKLSYLSDEHKIVEMSQGQNLSEPPKTMSGDGVPSHPGAVSSSSTFNQNVIESEEKSSAVTQPYDSRNEQKNFEDECKTVSSDTGSEKGGRQRGFPKTLRKMLPHIRKKFLENEDTPDDDSVSLVKGNFNPDSKVEKLKVRGLNPEAPEFRPPSATRSFENIKSTSVGFIGETGQHVKNNSESLEASESGSSEKQSTVSEPQIGDSRPTVASSFFKPTNVESVEKPEKTILKYTPEQLRALDPLRLTPEKKWENITEPYELRDIFPASGIKNLDLSSPLLAKTASDRYNTQQAPSLTGSVPMNTEWKDLCDFLLPQSRLKKSLFANHTSPGNEMCKSEISESQRKDSLSGSEEQLKNLQNTAHACLSSQDSYGENKEFDATHRLEGDRGDRESVERNRQEGQNSKKAENDEKQKHPETQVDKTSTNQSKKGKKKKTKFRPLDQVLIAKTGPSHEEESVEEYHHKSYGVDEFGFDDDRGSDSDTGIDPFNLEGLEPVGDGDETVIHPSRKIRYIGGTSSKPSLFAHVPRGQQQPKGQMWVPGKRKCTRCGSEDHVIYDCPKKATHHYEDQSFLLL